MSETILPPRRCEDCGARVPLDQQATRPVLCLHCRLDRGDYQQAEPAAFPPDCPR